MSGIISVIVTTYNWPDALRAVLESLMVQFDKGFEVVVADDGSGQETSNLITDCAARASFPIKSFWQEDNGFRPARSRNGAVALADGDYLIFIDGDCCVLPDFVTSHRRLMESGWFVTGKRCFLKKRFSGKIIENQVSHYKWSRTRWLLRGLFGACNRPLQFLPLNRTEAQRKERSEQWENAQTCNLAVSKADFFTINGFDTSYEGHGMEDSDFIIRLIRSGVKRKTADYTSPVLHFYHGRAGDGGVKVGRENPRRLDALLEDPERITPITGYSDGH